MTEEQLSARCKCCLNSSSAFNVKAEICLLCVFLPELQRKAACKWKPTEEPLGKSGVSCILNLGSTYNWTCLFFKKNARSLCWTWDIKRLPPPCGDKWNYSYSHEEDSLIFLYLNVRRVAAAYFLTSLRSDEMLKKKKQKKHHRIEDMILFTRAHMSSSRKSPSPSNQSRSLEMEPHSASDQHLRLISNSVTGPYQSVTLPFSEATKGTD